MGKLTAAKLRGQARLLDDVMWNLEHERYDAAKIVLGGVIVNLRVAANDEEQRGKDWWEERKRELARLGIPEGEPIHLVPPRMEPWFGKEVDRFYASEKAKLEGRKEERDADQGIS